MKLIFLFSPHELAVVRCMLCAQAHEGKGSSQHMLLIPSRNFLSNTSSVPAPSAEDGFLKKEDPFLAQNKGGKAS